MSALRLTLAVVIAAGAYTACGDNRSEAPLTPANYTLKPLWNERYDSSRPYDVVAGDGVVVVSGQTDPSGDDWDFLVRAYDGLTGTLRWQDRSDSGCDDAAGSMVIHEGSLFVAGDLCSRYVLRAYTLQTGEPTWEHQGAVDQESSAGTLLIAGDVLVLLGAEPGAAFIRAYDPSSGDLLWERLSQALLVGGRSDSRTLVTSHLVGNPADGFYSVLRSYDLGSGEPLWEKSEIRGKPIGRVYEMAVGEDLFVSYTKTRNEPESWWLTASSLRTGETVWQQSVSANRFLDDLLIGRDCIHIAGVQGVYDERSDAWWNASYVSCLRPRSGALVWEDQRGGKSGEQEALYAVRDGRRLAIGGFEMELGVYDAVTGKLAYERLDPTFDGRAGPIATDDDRIYAIAEVFADQNFRSTGILVQAYLESKPH